MSTWEDVDWDVPESLPDFKPPNPTVRILKPRKQGNSSRANRSPGNAHESRGKMKEYERAKARIFAESDSKGGPSKKSSTKATVRSRRADKADPDFDRSRDPGISREMCQPMPQIFSEEDHTMPIERIDVQQRKTETRGYREGRYDANFPPL